ncbi:hypothetical protein M2164_000198 [Streptomyces sp. SAI-208]|uniref:hypothetical protein n=1 Tax=Streptomyces sp. SAI-208 TaxID=2940550 RepID=UPI0024730FF8|nr:hypothetical protein [Streptomyces sp. SAI-208]MDH6604563.1 hypothetical protein [Streptomyces sp. SAI-208]
MTPADLLEVQGRLRRKGCDAARDVFWRLRLTLQQITQIWAYRGYACDLVDWARERIWLALRNVSRPRGGKSFVVLPRCGKAERTIGWCMNARRNARDHERLPQHAEAHLNWALITMMTRRLGRKSPRTSQWRKGPTR